MSQHPIPVPKIILLEPGQGNQPEPIKSADLRWARVEEFLRSRELAANTRKAYERELKRFLSWTPEFPEFTTLSRE